MLCFDARHSCSLNELCAQLYWLLMLIAVCAADVNSIMCWLVFHWVLFVINIWASSARTDRVICSVHGMLSCWFWPLSCVLRMVVISQDCTICMAELFISYCKFLIQAMWNPATYTFYPHVSTLHCELHVKCEHFHTWFVSWDVAQTNRHHDMLTFNELSCILSLRYMSTVWQQLVSK